MEMFFKPISSFNLKKIKIMFKKMFFAVIIALLTFSSCKKEPLNMTLLTTGKWKLTGQTENGRNVFNSNVNCESDDTWTFETSGVLKIDAGATKCHASDPQSYTAATWSLSGTEQKKLILVGNSSSASTELYDITELSSSTMKLTFTESGTTIVATFSKA
jgi:hypothetical protein